MNNIANKKSIRRITTTWGLVFPMCFIIGWSAGYFLDQFAAIGSEWCSVIGFCIGAGFGGVSITQEIIECNNRPLSLVGAFLGWAIGFLLIGYMWIELASAIM